MPIPPTGPSWFGSSGTVWWPSRSTWRQAPAEIRYAYRSFIERTHAERARVSYAIICLLGITGALVEYYFFPARTAALLLATVVFTGACLLSILIVTRHPARAVATTIVSNNILLLANCGYYALTGGSPEMCALVLVWLMTAFLFFAPSGTAQLLSCVATVMIYPFAVAPGGSANSTAGYVTGVLGGVAIMTAARAALIDAQRFAAFRRGEALRRSEADLRSIFDNLRDIFFRINRQGMVEMISPSVTRLGYQPEEIIGQATRVLYPDRDIYRVVQGRLMETTGGGSFELTIPDKHGNEVPVSINARVRVDPDGTFAGIEGVIRDISDRKRAEEKARQHQAQLAHVARVNTLGEMAAAVAHELHQPLAAIVNFTSGCERRLRADGNARPEILHALEQISEQALRAGEIIRRIRHFIRKEDPALDWVDINACVRNVIQLCDPEARALGVDIRIALAPDLPPIRGNGIQIEQVLMNLIRNGFEAVLENNGKSRELSVHSTASAAGLEITISDSGPGMPAELIDKIFEPFFSTKPHGLGLGLGISRSIVEAHGGRLLARVDPVLGTTFQLTLPLPEATA